MPAVAWTVAVPGDVVDCNTTVATPDNAAGDVLPRRVPVPETLNVIVLVAPVHRILPESLIWAVIREVDVLSAWMETGLAWIQAEHRVRPDFLMAQTGYMQGAAGIGMWLLRISSSQREAKERIMLPDSPW